MGELKGRGAEKRGRFWTEVCGQQVFLQTRLQRRVMDVIECAKLWES